MGRPPKYKTEEERKAAYIGHIRKWQLKNPEKKKKYAKTTYENNKEKYIDAAAQWKKDNPEKFKEFHAKSNRRSYLKRRIREKIEKVGAEEWLKVATEEELGIYTKYILKQD